MLDLRPSNEPLVRLEGAHTLSPNTIQNEVSLAVTSHLNNSCYYALCMFAMVDKEGRLYSKLVLRGVVRGYLLTRKNNYR